MPNWVLGFCERCNKNRYFERSEPTHYTGEEDVAENYTYVCPSCGLRVFEVPFPKLPLPQMKPKKKFRIRI